MPITKVNTPDGSIMNIDHPEGATQEQILQYAASQYQGRAPTPEPPEPEYETTVAGQAFEFAKAVPRGFANSFLSAGEGLAELADAATDFVGLEDAIDSGEENWLVEQARKGRDSVNQAIGADIAYRDQWTTKFGEGLGSFASFLTPAAGGKLLGAAGKAASLGRYGGAGTIAVGGGAGEQARRIEEAREQGIEVSNNEENLAILSGSVIGLSELAPVHRLFKGLSVKNSRPIMSRITSAMKQGGIEAVQEVTANFLQDVTERGIYNENLPEGETIFSLENDDATIGFAVGFLSDLVLNAAAGRRNTSTTQAQIEKELENREKENADFEARAIDLEAEREAQAAGQTDPSMTRAARAQRALEQERSVDPSQIQLSEEADTVRQLSRRNWEDPSTTTEDLNLLGRRYGSTIARQMGSAFPNNTSFGVEEGPTREVTRQIQDAEGNPVETTTSEPTFVVRDSEGQQYGTPQNSFENATRLAYSLNDEVLGQNVRETVHNILDVSPESYTPQDYEQMFRLGYRVLHPDFQTFTSAAVNEAAGTTQDKGYDETLSSEEAMLRNNDPDYTGNLTAAQKINRARLADGLTEADNFTVQEVRSVLGDKFGTISHTSINAPLETEVYEAGFEGEGDPSLARGLRGRGRPVVTSSAGEVIRDRKATVEEALSEENAPSWARGIGMQTEHLLRGKTKIPLRSIEEAQALANQLNANRDVAPVAEEVFLDDITVQDIDRLLETKNISSKATSPEVKEIAKAVVGTADVNRMSPGERRLLYQKLRAVPRLDTLTKIPLWKAKPYTRDQFAMALHAVEETGDSSLEAISASTGISPEETGGNLKLLALKKDLKDQGLTEAKAKQDDVAEESAPVISGLLPGPDNGLKELRANLRERRDSIGLKDVGLRVDRALQAVGYDANRNPIYFDEAAAAERGLGPVQEAEGFYQPAMNTIFLALDNTRVARQDVNATPEQKASAVADTLNHETIHALRQLDLWTAKEWFSLENLARRNINKETNSTYLDTARSLYGDQTAVTQMEEAVAEMIRHARRDNTLVTGKPRSLIQRLYDFMERLGSAMNGTGFQSFNDIVNRVNSGEVGGRARGEVRTLWATEAEAGIVPDREIVGRSRTDIEEAEQVVAVGEGPPADEPVVPVAPVAATGQSRPDFMASRVVEPRIPAPGEDLPVLPSGEVEEGLAELFKRTGGDPTSRQLANVVGSPKPRRIKTKSGKTTRNPLDVNVRPVDMEELRRRASIGLSGSDQLAWYDEFGLGIMDVVGPANLDEASVIFGVTSAQNSPELNLADTYHIMRIAREVNPLENEQAFKNAVRNTRRPGGQRLKVSGDQIDRITRMYKEGFAEGGMKTTTYMQLIQDRARNVFNPFSVQDVHMARVFGFLSRKKDAKTGNVVDDARLPGDLSYRYAQWMTSQLAKEFQVTPNQMQAALWFYAKQNLSPKKGGKAGTWESANRYARAEREVIEKQIADGVFSKDTPLTPALAKGVRPKNAIRTPTKPYSNVDQTEELMALARAEAPAVIGSAKPGNARGYGFPDTFTLDNQIDYNRRAIEVMTDADGQIPFVRDLGIPHEVSETMGSYEGLEPGITVKLLGGNIDQASMISSVLGDALLQDAAVVSQPRYNAGSNVGLKVYKTDGSSFTQGELEGIAESVNPEKDPDGLNFSLVSPSQIAFVDGKSFSEEPYLESDLREFYNNLTERLPKTLDLDTGAYYQDGKYIESGDYQENIEKIRDQRIAPGRSDIYQRINDTLYQPIWSLYTETAKELGFKPENNSRPTLADINKASPREEIKPLPADEVNTVVDENTRRAEEASSGFVPRVNYKADPGAQYIAKNPDKGLPVPPHLRDKFSRANAPELSGAAKAVADRIAADPTPAATPGETYIDATEGRFRGGVKDVMTRFRRAAVSQYAAVERLEQDPRLKGLLADSSSIAAVIFADRSRGILASALKEGVPIYSNGITKVVPFVHGQRTYKGLIDVLSPLYDNVYNKSLEKLAMMYAITRRGERLNAQGKKTAVTAGDRATIEAEIKQYVNPDTGRPIIEEWYDAWQAYNRNTVKFMVDTGVLNAKEGEHWLMHSDYYPFYKQDYADSIDLFKPVGESDRSGDPIDMDMLKSITRNLQTAIDMGMRNVAKQRVVRDAVTVGIARDADAEGVTVSEGDHVVNFRVNGKKRRFIMDDPLLYESLNTLSDTSEFPILTAVVGTPARFLRTMVTRDPGFVIANMLRDTLSAFVTSGSNYVPILGTIRGFKEGLSTLEKYGVAGGYDFKDDPADVVKFIARESRKREGSVGELGKVEELFEAPGLKYFKRAWQKTGEYSSMSDAATRKAVYDDVLARTGNEAEAAFQALEVINFSRRGANPLLRVIFAAVPFLNARIQGLDVLYRAFSGKYSARQETSRSKVALTAATRGITLMGLTGLYYALVSDTEEYKESSIQERDDYWIFPAFSINDSPLRIPIPFEVGVLFKVIPERILDSTYGTTTPRELKESMQRHITNTLEIDPLSNGALWGPLYEAAINKSGYTGQAIVPVWMDNGGDSKVAPAFQSRVGTNEAARLIGEQLKISPLKVEHVMSGYTGTLGRYALDLLDSSLRHGLDSNVLPKRELTQYPVIKRFFASPEGRGPQEQYYALKAEVDQLVTTMNRLENENRYDEADALYRVRSNIYGLRGDVNYLNKQLRKLRKEKDYVLRSDIYDAEEKAEMKRELDAEINELLNIMPELMQEAGLAAFGSPTR